MPIGGRLGPGPASTGYYDGLVDLTRATDYITVARNRIHDRMKCSVVGHSDNNASEDTGQLRVNFADAFVDCAERPAILFRQRGARVQQQLRRHDVVRLPLQHRNN